MLGQKLKSNMRTSSQIRLAAACTKRVLRSTGKALLVGLSAASQIPLHDQRYFSCSETEPSPVSTSEDVAKTRRESTDSRFSRTKQNVKTSSQASLAASDRQRTELDLDTDDASDAGDRSSTDSDSEGSSITSSEATSIATSSRPKRSLKSAGKIIWQKLRAASHLLPCFGGGEDDSETSSLADTTVSWDEDEYAPLEINYEALRHLAECLFEHGKCTDITEMKRGAYHEIRELHFEVGWSCIARFTRDFDEPMGVMMSEAATSAYVDKHTSIRTPEVYFINPNAHHVVGAPFVLMEKLPGRNLSAFWTKMPREHQMHVMGQMAEVQKELLQLKFDKVGSIQPYGQLGFLVDQGYSEREEGRGPFKNVPDWIASYLDPYDPLSEELAACYPKAANILMKFCEKHQEASFLEGPYRLFHGDFNGQNMLFDYSDPSQPPQLTGVIDWDYSQVGPLYRAVQYPIFLQPDPLEEPDPEDDDEELRKHFRDCLVQAFPEGSPERNIISKCLRTRSPTLDLFKDIFTGAGRVGQDLDDVERFLDAHNMSFELSIQYFKLEEEESDDTDEDVVEIIC